MKRRYLNDLKKWLTKPNRKPLLIRGARQVGKSTLVRQLAESEGLNLYEVNLEQHTELAAAVETLDLENILLEIEYICNRGSIQPEGSLIFLDEIQGMPRMLQCLRYFYEQRPDLVVIAAGSLLEFALAENPFPMPVGRIEYFFMGPVSWEEFLHAKEEPQLCDLLANYELGKPFPQAGHQRLVHLLREYFLTGGMPEAVQLHLNGEDWEVVFDAQNSVYQTYRDDFSKYAQGPALVRLQKILDYLGQGTGRKVKYVQIDSTSQARDIKQALDMIWKAGLVLQVQHSHGDGVPLASQIDPKVFKLYSLDIGILNRICRLDHLNIQRFQEDSFVNESILAEQFVAQQFYFRQTPKQSPELHYWLREGKTGNAEVDFLVQSGQEVIPVEVKSGKSGTLKSLFQFANKKNASRACRFDLNLPSCQNVVHHTQQGEITMNLLSLPLYLCHQLDRMFADSQAD